MKQFNTRDVNLATFLLYKGMPPPEIVALDAYHSAFIFDEPPPELLREWLEGTSYVKVVIDTYRHLLKDAFTAQKQLGQGGGR